MPWNTRWCVQVSWSRCVKMQECYWASSRDGEQVRDAVAMHDFQIGRLPSPDGTQYSYGFVHPADRQYAGLHLRSGCAKSYQVLIFGGLLTYLTPGPSLSRMTILHAYSFISEVQISRAVDSVMEKTRLIFQHNISLLVYIENPFLRRAYQFWIGHCAANNVAPDLLKPSVVNIWWSIMRFWCLSQIQTGSKLLFCLTNCWVSSSPLKPLTCLRYVSAISIICLVLTCVREYGSCCFKVFSQWCSHSAISTLQVCECCQEIARPFTSLYELPVWCVNHSFASCFMACVKNQFHGLCKKSGQMPLPLVSSCHVSGYVLAGCLSCDQAFSRRVCWSGLWRHDHWSSSVPGSQRYA